MLARASPTPMRSALSASRSRARMGITLKSAPVRATAPMKAVSPTRTKPTRPARSWIWATKDAGGRLAARRHRARKIAGLGDPEEGQRRSDGAGTRVEDEGRGQAVALGEKPAR